LSFYFAIKRKSKPKQNEQTSKDTKKNKLVATRIEEEQEQQEQEQEQEEGGRCIIPAIRNTIGSSSSYIASCTLVSSTPEVTWPQLSPLLRGVSTFRFLETTSTTLLQVGKWL